MEYYSGKSNTKKSTPFNPEEIYRNLTLDDNDTIIEGKLDCVRFDDKGRKIPLNRKIDIWYILDANQHRYRMYTNETKYGEFQEIIYYPKRSVFRIKNIDNLRSDWKKAHPKERNVSLESFIEVKI